LELPGAELVEIFFGSVGGDFQGAVGFTVNAGGDGVAVVADEFGDAGVEEEGEVTERALGCRDFDRFAVDGDFRAVGICFGGEGEPGAGLIGEFEAGILSVAHPEEFTADIFDFDFACACGAIGCREFVGHLEGLLAQRARLRRDFHFESAVVGDRESARERHASSPACGEKFGVGALFSDPAPEDAIAFGVKLRFLRVVGAVIENAALLGMEDEFLGIEIADFPKNTACRGIKQNPFLVEREKVGTFPHFAGADGIGTFSTRPLAFGERVEIFPVAKISGFVEQDASTFFRLAGGYAAIPGASVRFGGGGCWDAKQEWIAEAGEIGILRRLDDGPGEFLPAEEIWVLAGGKALRLAKIMMAIAKRGAIGGNGFDSGVNDGGGVVVVDGAAGETAVGIVAAGSRSERDWLVLPVNHVVAHGVIPVHVAPDGGVGIVLEEHVVFAAPKDGAIGVVHPVFGGEEMELGAKGVGGESVCVGERIGGEEIFWVENGQCGRGGGFQEVPAGISVGHAMSP
jgi:hypothetical protein